MQHFERVYIGGTWRAPHGTGLIDVVNPATEGVIGHAPACDALDVDSAVAAARTALPAWSNTSPLERARFLGALAGALAEQRDEIAATITAEVGMPLELSKRIQAALPAGVCASYAELLSHFAFEQRIAHSLVVREPVGVVACITPWNYPLHQIVANSRHPD